MDYIIEDMNLENVEYYARVDALSWKQSYKDIVNDDFLELINTEPEIQKAIDNLKGDYTIMIIAHRLSTIKSADKIFYISDGKVLMEGSHEYLLKNCKEYKDLYNTEINKLT